MSVLLQVDFPFAGPWGEAMTEALRGLAESIANEPGLIWKIWTENPATAEAGGISLGQAALLWLGRISYSLFLVHFPVLVFVAALWSHLEWTSPPLATLGLVVAFFTSLALAGIFYRWIEAPSARAARQIGRTWRQSALALADSR